MIGYISFQIHFYAFTNVFVCVHLYLHTLDIYTSICDLHNILYVYTILYILFCKLISISICHRCMLIVNCPLMIFLPVHITSGGYDFQYPVQHQKGSYFFIFAKTICKDTYYYFI